MAQQERNVLSRFGRIWGSRGVTLEKEAAQRVRARASFVAIWSVRGDPWRSRRVSWALLRSQLSAVPSDDTSLISGELARSGFVWDRRHSVRTMRRGASTGTCCAGSALSRHGLQEYSGPHHGTVGNRSKPTHRSDSASFPTVRPAETLRHPGSLATGVKAAVGLPGV